MIAPNPMTHDELLAKIDELGVTFVLLAIEFNSGKATDEQIGSYLPFKPLEALSAVVELHKPEPQLDETLIRKEVLVCGHCWSNKLTWGAAHRYVYPCPTIQAIEEQLK